MFRVATHDARRACYSTWQRQRRTTERFIEARVGSYSVLGVRSGSVYVSTYVYDVVLCCTHHLGYLDHLDHSVSILQVLGPGPCVCLQHRAFEGVWGRFRKALSILLPTLGVVYRGLWRVRYVRHTTWDSLRTRTGQYQNHQHRSITGQASKSQQLAGRTTD